MDTGYPPEQVEELKLYCQSLKANLEGGITYFLLENIQLPAGCSPEKCDVLLRPVAGPDGYGARLFFSQPISSPTMLNWHVTDAYMFERTWTAFSWRVNNPNLTLAENLREYLSALVRPL